MLSQLRRWRALCSTAGVRPLVSFVIPVRNDVPAAALPGQHRRQRLSPRADRDRRRRQRVDRRVGLRRARVRRDRAAVARRSSRGGASQPRRARRARQHHRVRRLRSRNRSEVDRDRRGRALESRRRRDRAAYLTQPSAELGAAAIRRAARARPTAPRRRDLAWQRQLRGEALGVRSGRRLQRRADRLRRRRPLQPAAPGRPPHRRRSRRCAAFTSAIREPWGAVLRRAVARPRQPARHASRPANASGIFAAR